MASEGENGVEPWSRGAAQPQAQHKEHGGQLTAPAGMGPREALISSITAFLYKYIITYYIIT